MDWKTIFGTLCLGVGTMIDLINLEMQKHKMKTYYISFVVITLIMLGFLFLFAYAPTIDPKDQELTAFFSYDHLIPLFSVLNMAVFCVLAAIMYAKLIIEEFSGKRLYIICSYAVPPHRILIAKLVLVTVFTLVTMTACNIICIFIYAIIEQEPSSLFLQTVVGMVLYTIAMAVNAASVAIIATGVGFIKKSIPTTIVSAVLLASLICNIEPMLILNIKGNVMLVLLVLLSAIYTAFMLIYKVNSMEVE